MCCIGNIPLYIFNLLYLTQWIKYFYFKPWRPFKGKCRKFTSRNSQTQNSACDSSVANRPRYNELAHQASTFSFSKALWRRHDFLKCLGHNSEISLSEGRNQPRSECDARYEWSHTTAVAEGGYFQLNCIGETRKLTLSWSSYIYHCEGTVCATYKWSALDAVKRPQTPRLLFDHGEQYAQWLTGGGRLYYYTSTTNVAFSELWPVLAVAVFCLCCSKIIDNVSWDLCNIYVYVYM